MYVVESKGGAIACMLLALLFLGTWPAILTLLERRGRLPQHTYLDYSITNLLAAIIIALTFGEIGKSTLEMPNFLVQLSQASFHCIDNWPSVMFAMAGGVVLSLGNLSTQYAWAFVGLSVTEVITASITVVIGTTLNYFLDDRINRAEILFPGVGCFLVAVCLASAVHSSNAADNEAKLEGFSSKEGELEISTLPSKDGEMEDGGVSSEKAKAGTAEFLVQLEKRRAIKVFGKSTLIGLSICFFAGVCFSLFSPAFNLATNDQWHTLKDGVPHLVVYTAFFYFSISCFIIAIILNITFLYYPVLDLPKSSFKAYMNDWNGRGWALMAGLLCGFGNGLQFMGGQAAGYAAADAVQVGTSISEYILGNSSVWRVQKIIKKNIYIASEYVVYVYCGCCCSHGISRASKIGVYVYYPLILLLVNGDCYMRGNTHFIVPAKRFELLGDSNQFLTTYTFGTHTAKHTFCKVCGITSFYIPRSNPDGVAVTFKCVDPGTLLHVESKGGAIACMLLALLFLGTWPAILTLLERRGKLPQHTYLDYSITNLLAAVIIAFTFGEIGNSTPEMPNFLIQLSQENWPSVLFAMLGGVVLSLGNLSTQYAWAFVGLSVTEVITSSITVVIGTTMNYFLDDQINRAEILFPGVGCFLIAVCLASAVHSSNAADNEAKLGSLSSDQKEGNLQMSTLQDKVGSEDLEDGSVSSEKAKVGTAEFLMQLERKRSIKVGSFSSFVFGRNTSIGLAICFFAGVCFSLFSPAFNLATNDQWHTLKDRVPHLVVYTAFFYFSVSCFVIAIILNITFLYYPVLDLPRSSFKAYVNDWNGRGWALLAGLLCGFGNGLQFMGGQAAGYAAADAVQALPLVSTFWGILLFGEYRKSSRRTYILLLSMLFMFIAAVAVLMASSGHRK
ncbi:hypothetical protein G4B88_019116 [Cannabis sativa]|uniref:CENP-V/GFA domain-containing protein n=1 Tax=Cannabis sativa TaxID=3483 RepID=A0A7J6HM25_CANSA|nr:hypothetical protein G4B88_019116 [Cannabis sativa]